MSLEARGRQPRPRPAKTPGVTPPEGVPNLNPATVAPPEGTPRLDPAVERSFVEGLIERGEIAPAGEKLLPGQTHQVDKSGNVGRKRFSIA